MRPGSAFDLGQPHQTPPLKRRSVVRAATWAVPVIATTSAAPRVSGSCAPTPLVTGLAPLAAATNSATFTRTDALHGTYTWANPYGTGSNITASIVGNPITSNSPTNFYQASTNLYLHNQTNGTGTISEIGGLGESGVTLSVGGNPSNGHMEYTVTFSVAVTNLRFTITDIDQGENVWVTTTPSSVTIPDASYIGGSGTAASPWTPKVGNTEIAASSTRGNVEVHYASAVMSSFTVGVTTNNTPSAFRHVYLSAMAFTPVSCP